MLVIDKLIYEEQIELLSYLNKQPKACPESSLFVYFKNWQERTKNQDYNFQNFLNFLLQQGLIAQSIDGYTISLIGKEYLSFLIKVGKPISREEKITKDKEENSKN